MRGRSSRLLAVLLVVASPTLVSLVSRQTRAQELGRFERIPPSTPPRALPDEPPRGPGEPPAAQTGFQVAFRTGVALPAGAISAADNDRLGDTFAWQVPLLVELGAKPIPWLFVGVYAGAGFGGVAPSFEQHCNGVAVSCSSRTVRIGIEGLIHLRPGDWFDPWVGYGLGYESTTLVGEARGRFATQSLSGVELAHLMAGFDVRISHTIGLGPYVDVALGRYGSISRGPGTMSEGVEEDIANRALHGWITLGVRLVVFP